LELLHELTPAGTALPRISKQIPAKIPADREFEDQARSGRGPPDVISGDAVSVATAIA